MDELRGRWWNRLHGRRARKDLWLWQDGSLWIVGARSGGSDAHLWRRQFDREAKARALIDQILARNGGRRAWLDMTKLTSPQAGQRGPE
jgi:hypothetical protein